MLVSFAGRAQAHDDNDLWHGEPLSVRTADVIVVLIMGTTAALTSCRTHKEEDHNWYAVLRYRYYRNYHWPY
jgi:hypothetical protein